MGPFLDTSMYKTIQYNNLLLQSQTDRCESDIHNDM